jgi:hypothetical protein
MRKPKRWKSIQIRWPGLPGVSPTIKACADGGVIHKLRIETEKVPTKWLFALPIRIIKGKTAPQLNGITKMIKSSLDGWMRISYKYSIFLGY